MTGPRFRRLADGKAIEGNKLVPRAAYWCLARTGYKSQQTNIPEESGRQDNLWEPVPGDHGAHGDFDRQAHRYSYQLWATTHSNWVAWPRDGLRNEAALAA
jgi:hypothetical protein